MADGVEVNENQGDNVCIAITSGGWFDDDNGKALRANARLIAAAPDLLEACRALGSLVKEYDPTNSTYRLGTDDLIAAIELGRAAVAKATQQEIAS